MQYKYAFEVQDVQWNSTSQQLQNSFRFGQIDNWVTGEGLVDGPRAVHEYRVH